MVVILVIFGDRVLTTLYSWCEFCFIMIMVMSIYISVCVCIYVDIYTGKVNLGCLKLLMCMMLISDLCLDAEEE